MIWHAQDARNYAPWVGLSALALALGLRLLARRVEGWRDWLLYALAAAAALALAYQEAAVLLALTAYALWSRWRDAAFLRRWLAVQGALLGLIAVVFLALQGNLLWGGGYGGNLELLSLGALLELPVTLAFGETLPAAWSPWLGPTLWLAGGSAAIWLWQQKAQRQSMLMAGTLLLVPILLLALAGLKWRVFHARYVLASAAGLALLAAAALDRLAQRSRVVASVAALPIAFLMAYSLGQYYGPYQKAVDWRALVEWMSGSLSSADAVIQQSRDPAFSWHFARAETGAAELAFPASPGQPNAEIERELAAAASYATLWTVGREYGDWPECGSHGKMARGGASTLVAWRKWRYPVRGVSVDRAESGRNRSGPTARLGRLFRHTAVGGSARLSAGIDAGCARLAPVLVANSAERKPAHCLRSFGSNW